ncbi:MAG: formate dehydrogenase subunit gamma, partial [Burkholderiaceae bacterium]
MNTPFRKTMLGKTILFFGSLFAMVALSLALPFSGLLMTDDGVAIAQDKEALSGTFGDKNPRSDFWRAVRDGNSGRSQVQGVDSGMLINNGGENWRQLRNGPIYYWGGIVLAVMAGLIVLFHLLSMATKSTRLEHGRSGVKIPRWDQFTRLLHWVTAITFILLSVTGLSLFYGRELLIPLLGKDAFAAWASVAKEIHNYGGPIFGVSLTLMLLLLVRHNIPNGTDVKWLLKGGGLFSKNSHPHAGRMNAGEKVWFWLLATVGMAVVVTGFVMLFNLGISRADSQTAMLVHGIASLVIMAVALGHIYIGTAG